MFVKLESSLKQAQPDDVPLLLSLIRAYYEFDGISFHEERTQRALGRLLCDPSLGRAWIIRSGASRVGYVLLTFGFDLEFGGPVATITEFFILPDYRRMGLGTKVIRFLEDTCRELGICYLELQVERDNVDAQGFYAKQGFVPHDRIPLTKHVAS